MDFETYDCDRCGGNLTEIDSETYKCQYCGKTFHKKEAEEQTKTFRDMFDEMKREHINNLRRNLYDAVNAEYISSFDVKMRCEELKKLLPNDFAACFYEVAAGNNVRHLTKYIRKVDVQKNYGEIEDIVKFLIKSLQTEYLLDLNNLVERAYKNRDLSLYEKYSTAISIEAEKVTSGVYETKMPREVFVAYSSKDMDKVSELVEFLEDQGLRCFVAARNLRHGKNSVENYEKLLREAMDHCKSFVFVSSQNSRNFNCDALIKELSYIQQKDVENAPAELRYNYASISHKYKMPRVEYRIEESNGFNAADSISNEFFDGYERVYSPESVSQRVIKQLLVMPAKEDDRPYVDSGFGDNSKVERTEQTQRMDFNGNLEALVKRIFLFLDDADFENAEKYCERVLDIDAENPSAYLGKFCVEFKLKKLSELWTSNIDVESIKSSRNYAKLILYGSSMSDEVKRYIHNKMDRENEVFYNLSLNAKNAARSVTEYRAAAEKFRKLIGYKDSFLQASECNRLANEMLYTVAINAKHQAKTDIDYKNVADKFKEISGYKDSNSQYNECIGKAKEIQYLLANSQMDSASSVEDFDEAARSFAQIKEYRDSSLLYKKCITIVRDMNKLKLYQEACQSMSQSITATDYQAAASRFFQVRGYRDAEQRKKECYAIAREKICRDIKKAQKTIKGAQIIQILLRIFCILFWVLLGVEVLSILASLLIFDSNVELSDHIMEFCMKNFNVFIVVSAPIVAYVVLARKVRPEYCCIPIIMKSINNSGPANVIVSKKQIVIALESQLRQIDVSEGVTT